MSDKKSNGGGNGGGQEPKVGDVVVYQPIRRDWLRGGAQVPGLVQAVHGEGEGATADLTISPTPGTWDFVHNCSYGDQDGQYMKAGEESKTAKAMKQATEEAKKAAEEKAKKDEEEAKKIQQEAKEKKSEGGFPTAQTQLDADQRRAQMQYKYPQPPPES